MENVQKFLESDALHAREMTSIDKTRWQAVPI